MIYSTGDGKFLYSRGKLDIWSVRRLVEWRPCNWWLQGHFTTLNGTLQSRLDVEFLLLIICSVKFKEWIVVLATLLKRSELWKAYYITLQVG